MPSLAQVDFTEDGLAPSLHSMLREATRAQHEALDATLSRFDLADASSYHRFLQVHHRALVVLLERCCVHDRRELAPLLALLEDDLGLASAPAAPGIDLPPSDGTTVGVAYVLRGSRLGAVHLRRRVGAALPTRYLGHQVATSWTGFLTHMAAVPRNARSTGEVIDAARMAFGVFVRAADEEASPLAALVAPINLHIRGSRSITY